MPWLLPQLILAAWMCGVIWLVQLVVYPQFARVGEAEFAAYHRAHTSGIAGVVIPAMLLELGLAVAAWWQQRDAFTAVMLGLVVAIWAVTAACQVPLHQRLAKGRDAAAIRSLVRTNALRTGLWTARLAGCVWLLASPDAAAKAVEFFHKTT
jgi:uncharacterized membrane protein